MLVCQKCEIKRYADDKCRSLGPGNGQKSFRKAACLPACLPL